IAHAHTPHVVIAADGGSVLAEEMGLTPDLIVGDIDSSPSELVARFEKAGVDVRRYDHATKWETDTELALLAALEWKPGFIYVLGAIGGRLDHSLANVMLLTNPRFADVELHILDGVHELFVAKTGEWNDIPGKVGSTVSLIPVGGAATGVETKGLHWPLNGETLPQGQGRGVSNLIEIEGNAAVRHESGILLVIIVHL
ncbi:MAG: thiamine diphosphokinase, partial [Chloroflexia bacterium]